MTTITTTHCDRCGVECAKSAPFILAAFVLQLHRGVRPADLCPACFVALLREAADKVEGETAKADDGTHIPGVTD